jgi:hypothetical protein
LESGALKETVYLVKTKASAQYAVRSEKTKEFPLEAPSFAIDLQLDDGIVK